MELRKYRKATAKRRSMEDNEIGAKKMKAEKIVLKHRKNKIILQKQADENGNDVKNDDDNNNNCDGAMTLEQFTDIVLASEGMTVKEAKEQPKSSDPATNQMVQNILQNKDLTVEVKPVRVKPVVLSPRNPPRETPATSSSAVVMSVRPRVHPVLPENKPLDLPLMVEEWFSRMDPPPCEDNGRHSGLLVTKDQALNLSTKEPPRTTQVYLRPITSADRRPSMASTPSLTISPSPSKADRIQYSPPNQNSWKPNLISRHYGPLSPPRLEIRKLPVRSEVTTVNTTLLRRRRLVGRAAPIIEENVRARATRDLQAAHHKDMHGNFPIHMSVLMRKPELVKRYCCVLQILDSSVDLMNDDKLSPLHLAVRDNSAEIVELLLAFGANPAVKDVRGNSSIHLAVAAQANHALKVIAENVRSKDVLNSLNDFGVTALHVAIIKDDKEAIDTLLLNGASPDVPDGNQGITPLQFATQERLVHLLDRLQKFHTEEKTR